MRYGKSIIILVVMLMILNLPVNSISGLYENNFNAKDDNKHVVLLSDNDFLVENIVQKVTENFDQENSFPPLNPWNIKALDIWLSSEAEDWDKNHVVTNPNAGQDLYIHWQFRCFGVGSRDFYNRIWIRTTDNPPIDAVDYEQEINNAQGGHIYTYCFSNPWTAPGGNYKRSLFCDIYNDVLEIPESDNEITIPFTVSPTNQKNDMEASDAWMSSQPDDWDRLYEIFSPQDEGTEIYFYFEWIIDGLPETYVDPYWFKLEVIGPDGFEYDEYIDNYAFRETWSIITTYYSDDDGNGWIATPGMFTITWTIDSEFNIIEWDENNNQYDFNLQIDELPNECPYTPAKPSGPETGDVDILYEYCTVTTDPDDDKIFYLFDWDDGTNSGWVGPYDSGEPGCASHIWDTPGIYQVKAKAKDVHVPPCESGWSVHLSVEIIDPGSGAELDIVYISGGFGKISVVIQNDGETTAEDVEWKIFLHDGLIILPPNPSWEGSFPSLDPGAETTISTTGLILGMGTFEVTVEVSASNADKRTVTAPARFFFFIFIIIS